HYRVDDGPSGGDVAAGGDELVERADTFFEEIADTSRPPVQQIACGACFDVLGKDENGNIGVALPYRGSGAKAFVCVRRRHADIGDDEVRNVVFHRFDERLGVGHVGGDGEPTVDQKTHDARPDEGGVVGDNDPKWPFERQRSPTGRPAGDGSWDALEDEFANRFE